MRTLTILAMLFLIGGCATASRAPDLYQRGAMAPDTFLATVMVLPQGCAPMGLACTVAGPGGATVIVPKVEGMPGWVYEMFAHEVCHVVAAVRELRDSPCHREDGGLLQ